MKIIHLDLKRQNIIKTKDGYKLIDFDLAVFLGLTNDYINHRDYLCGS
jgi:serine/threonine protein kinase